MAHLDALVAQLKWLSLKVRVRSMEAHVHQQSSPYSLLVRLPWMENAMITGRVFQVNNDLGVEPPCSTRASVTSENKSGTDVIGQNFFRGWWQRD